MLSPASQEICVIIPVHKKDLTHSEKSSLISCVNLLKDEDIYLVIPFGLDISAYLKIAKNLKICEVAIEWLKSWGKYNLMKRSLDFYNLFKNYKFMLTYELDCLIFSKDWNTANTFSYDFIGAPWFEMPNTSEIPIFKNGLNSGFSMRNISTSILILKSIKKTEIVWEIFKFLQLHRIVKLSKILSVFDLKWKTGENVFFFAIMNKEPIHEDYYWTVIIPKLFHFKVAPVCDASKFSFEVNPSYLYQYNGKELPLGCHAWEKYEPSFWNKILHLHQNE